MAQTGQDVVVALAAMRRRRDAVRGGADFPYPRGATTLTPETPESHYCHAVSERSTLHAMSDPEVRGSTAEERAVGAFADAQAAMADSPRDRQERGTDE